METKHKPFWAEGKLSFQLSFLPNYPFEIGYKDSVGDYTESLAKLKVDNTAFSFWQMKSPHHKRIKLVWHDLSL